MKLHAVCLTERQRTARNERKSVLSCLQVEKVSCRYNGQNVLEQLSLTVADNEIVCLSLVASGCAEFNTRGTESCLACK